MSSTAHHSSHLRLLEKSGPGRTDVPVDAIIVPSARRAAALAEAGRLAGALGCTLLVLCSKHADAFHAVTYLARYPDLDVIAVDHPAAGVARLPALETSALLGNSRLRMRTDTGAKRNLGLVLARLAGWKRVVFLDDDIVVPDPVDLRRAVSLLDDRDGVGLLIGGFPDNSVVCHANRVTGAPQDTFVGGGALAVPADRIDSFFPEIYNEDWFFLLGNTTLRPVAQVGTALQKPYDPFADPARARDEEFGDVLAEGLFALFHDGGRISDADRAYWNSYLSVRLAFIEEIRTRIESKAEAVTGQEKDILGALAAASGRLQFFGPRHCVAYIEAWARDRDRWRAFMRGLRPIRNDFAESRPIEVAIERLALRAFMGVEPTLDSAPPRTSTDGIGETSTKPSTEESRRRPIARRR